MNPKNNRLSMIDDIRGISIIVMILIHTNAYFMKVKTAFTLLEVSQFAVVAFIFCSSYLFYLKNPVTSLSSYGEYFKKRVRRLVVPYYLFLVGYFIFLLIREPRKLTLPYLFQNLTMTGGIDFNWLVLLFVWLTLLMPFFAWLKNSMKPVLYLYVGAAIASSVVFLKFTPLPYYRWIMWLPWSLVVIYTMYFDRIKDSRKWFWGLTLLFFILYILSLNLAIIPLHRSIRMYDNKYPPNIYHLAYSLFAVNILYFLSKINLFAPLHRLIHFFSKYSYTIYFIHILVIYVLTVFLKIRFSWVGFFLAVAGLTSAIQFAYNSLQKKEVPSGK